MFENANWTAFKFWLDLVSTVAVFLFFVWTVLKQKQKDNGHDIKQLKEEQERINRKLLSLEETQARLATHTDLAEVKAQVNGLKEKIEAQNNLLQTIHQFLLNDKRS